MSSPTYLRYALVPLYLASSLAAIAIAVALSGTPVISEAIAAQAPLLLLAQSDTDTSAPAQAPAAAPEPRPEPVRPQFTQPQQALPPLEPPPDVAEPAPRAKPAPSVAAKSATGTAMSLKTLEKRLKDSKALGMFAKIELKSQIDDLTERFRQAHQAGLNNVAALRQPFERLLAKVQSLLQVNDPALAGDIVASREQIWSVFADPKKFKAS